MTLLRIRAHWPPIAILLAALLFRALPLVGSTPWYDDAVEGLMSQDVLRGRFPLFFYGQPYHGAADRYLAAPFLMALGPTPIALALPPLCLFLVFVASLWAATRRVFGPDVAAIAALLLAVPPFYLFGWSFDARGHYHLMLILGTWSLYLAARILEERAWRSPARRFVGLGLLAGLSWWINYLSVTYLAPVAVALVVQGLADLSRRWRPLSARAALALTAFAAGSAPLFGYYLANGLPLIPPGSPVNTTRTVAHVVALATEALPQILGVHDDLLGRAYGPVYLIVAAAVLGAVVYAARWGFATRSTPGPGPYMVGLLLGVAAMTLVLSVLTVYGTILRYPRYLLPLYLALPVFVGLATQALGRRSTWLAALYLGTILTVNYLGSLTMTPLLASPKALYQLYYGPTRVPEQLEFLGANRLERVYDGLNLWTFLSRHRVLSSHPYEERMPEVARGVDAAERIGWLFKKGTAAAFEDSLRAAGIDFRLLNGPYFIAYTDFALPNTGYVEIEPTGWSAAVSDRSEGAALAFDRSLETSWQTPEPQRPGLTYELDLGRAHRVGKIAWLPRYYQETPRSFSVALSADRREWREVLRVPQYFGPLYWSGRHPFQRVRRSRIEVRFPPAEARFVRLTLLAGDRRLAWSMRELLVAAPAGECPQTPDAEAVVRFLLGKGIRFAYADHWLSANIAMRSEGRIRVLPSDILVDAYGLVRPDPNATEALRVRSDRAVVVEACPAETADAVAARLGENGVDFARETLGGLVVFSGFRAAADVGAPARWEPADTPDGLLRLSFGEPRTVSRIVLDCRAPLRSPAPGERLTVETSVDGMRFVEVPVRVSRHGTLRMSGSWLFPDAPSAVVIEMSARPVRSLRVARRPAQPEWCQIRAVRVAGAG